jgi:hypothetical protein
MTMKKYPPQGGRSSYKLASNFHVGWKFMVQFCAYLDKTRVNEGLQNTLTK